MAKRRRRDPGKPGFVIRGAGLTLTMPGEVPYERGCTNKKPYRTKNLARESAAQVRKHTGEALVAYKCPTCRSYHIGHRRMADAR